jgi:HNH endonuclease
MKEEYRSIDDNYSISNHGNVKHHDNLVEQEWKKYDDESTNYYWHVTIGDIKHKVHRLVASAFIANPNNYSVVDHIDREPCNNKVNNLRWCSHGQNMNNKGTYKNNKSGHTGVSYVRYLHKWKAQISVNKKTYIGLFETEQEAIIYRKLLEKKRLTFDPVILIIKSFSIHLDDTTNCDELEKELEELLISE